MIRRSKLLALLIGPILASCTTPGYPIDPAALSRTTIYSPPVRLGGKGGIIVLPASKRRDGPSKMSLEKPDPTLEPPTGFWLIGTWLNSATTEDVSRLACNSGTVMSYNADGTTYFWEGEGRWQLDGDRLTETLTSVTEGTGDPRMLREVGKPSSTRIWRVGPDEGAVWEKGEWQRMLRCRSGDIK